MVHLKKKPFSKCQTSLKNGIKYMNEYSERSRRAYLCIWMDNTGLQYAGTTNMKDCLKSQLDRWNRVGNLDTLILNSEDSNEVESCRGLSVGTEVLSTVYNNTEICKLPMPLNKMNEKDIRSWLCPQILKCIVEDGRESKPFISWGKEFCRPSFWPEDLVPWSEMTNIRKDFKKKQLPMFYHCLKINSRHFKHF